MSNTYKHKLVGKFNAGLMSVAEMPMTILKMWNRDNFDKGQYKRARRDQAAKDYERAGLNEINETVI